MSNFIPVTKMIFNPQSNTFKEGSVVYINTNHILSFHLEKYWNLVSIDFACMENSFYIKESLSEITMCL